MMNLWTKWGELKAKDKKVTPIIMKIQLEVCSHAFFGAL